MGASNYKTIMPAMEQQDTRVLVQLLLYTLHPWTISKSQLGEDSRWLTVRKVWSGKSSLKKRRYRPINHPSQGGCEDFCPFPFCIPGDFCFFKSTLMALQNYYKSSSSWHFKSKMFFKPGSSRVRIFWGSTLVSFLGWLRSAACPLQVPLYGCKRHDIDGVGASSLEDCSVMKVLKWGKIGDFLNFKKLMVRFLEGFTCAVSVSKYLSNHLCSGNMRRGTSLRKMVKCSLRSPANICKWPNFRGVSPPIQVWGLISAIRSLVKS